MHTKLPEGFLIFFYRFSDGKPLVASDKGFSFERNCVLHWWESKTLIKVTYQPQG